MDSRRETLCARRNNKAGRDDNCMHTLYCPMGDFNLSYYECRLKEESNLVGITLRRGICYSLSEFRDDAFRHLMGNLDANLKDAWNAYQFIDQFHPKFVRFDKRHIVLIADTEYNEQAFDCVQFVLNAFT